MPKSKIITCKKYMHKAQHIALQKLAEQNVEQNIENIKNLSNENIYRKQTFYQLAFNTASKNCATPCTPNRSHAGEYYGKASNCKNDGTQGSCYMYSYPDPRGPMPSTNMLAPVGPKSRRFAKNFIPQKANANGLRLLFDNNKFTLTGSSVGRVGTSAASSRAIQRGRASARNATRLSYINK